MQARSLAPRDLSTEYRVDRTLQICLNLLKSSCQLKNVVHLPDCLLLLLYPYERYQTWTSILWKTDTPWLYCSSSGGLHSMALIRNDKKWLPFVDLWLLAPLLTAAIG